jgi:NAD(P)H dehydrogenase (quinone)
MSAPVKIAVVYFSGYGHTAKVAESVARGAGEIANTEVTLINVGDGEKHWDYLETADAIIMGAPTYMGSLAAPFKAWIDESSNAAYMAHTWEGKIAAGFTIGGSHGGDKQTSLFQLVTFAAQQQMHWVTPGLNFGNNRTFTTQDILNRDTYSIGVAAQCDVDQPAANVPESDLRSAEYLGRRVANFAAVVAAGRKALGQPANIGVSDGSENQDPEHRGVEHSGDWVRPAGQIIA